MGFFARLLRRSKATEDASAAEPRTETESGGCEAEEPVVTAVPAAGSGAATAEAEAPEGGETDRPDTAEATEIPKQQSAEEAADNEAGDGART
ncbi:hypothetical protein ACFY0F_27625 [Streptomyces sp. NPDC001544]|uniref:hypothetical protein n=1 Tax=Streptomyces sp. NPDC001544 TaxID=3364584 RepID=UPI0036794EFA